MANILITGASNGIGAEIVRTLAKSDNHQIFALARSVEKLHTLAKECSLNSKSKVIPIEFDLEDVAYGALLVEISRYTNQLDGVVHNAGVLIARAFEDFTPFEFDKIFNINVKAPYFLTQTLLSLLLPGSHVVMISSMGGFQGSAKFAGLSAYSAAKGALTVLSESLATELAPRKIAVNALALGATQTEMLQKAFPGYEAPVSAKTMAGFITWFALHGHRVMNGKVVPVALSNP